MQGLRIRAARHEHLEPWMQMGLLLWPDNRREELHEEFAALLQDEAQCAFLCFDGVQAIGFIQVSLRMDYVEGTDSSPVGYVEGIYVAAPYRHRGAARLLISAGEGWARGRGCTQMASDCELNNVGSIAFHQACGYKEANRIVCFVKSI